MSAAPHPVAPAPDAVAESDTAGTKILRGLDDVLAGRYDVVRWPVPDPIASPASAAGSGLPTVEKMAEALWETNRAIELPQAASWATLVSFEGESGEAAATIVTSTRARAAAIFAHLAEPRPAAAVDPLAGAMSRLRTAHHLPHTMTDAACVAHAADHELDREHILCAAQREAQDHQVAKVQARTERDGALRLLADLAVHGTVSHGQIARATGLDALDVRAAVADAEERAEGDIPPLSDAAASLPPDLMICANAIVSAAMRQAGDGDRAVMLGAVVQGMAAALRTADARVGAGAVRERHRQLISNLAASSEALGIASAQDDEAKRERFAATRKEDIAALDAALAEAGPDVEGWRPMSQTPDAGRKVIALYDDGSGAVMLWLYDGGTINSDGDEDGPWPPKACDRWAYLPDELEFFCETGEDPIFLSAPAQPDGSEV